MQRTIYKSVEFEEYYQTLPKKVQEKYDYALKIIISQTHISSKFVKKLINTDFYEARISLGTNEYRTILFAIDKESIFESTKILLLNSFLKKSTKQYESEIRKACEILNRYSL